MSPSSIQLYDIFLNDLKLDNNSARAFADTIRLTVNEIVEMQQTQYLNQFNECKIQVIGEFAELKIEVTRALSNNDLKFESLKGEFAELKIEVTKALINNDLKFESLKGEFAELKIEITKALSNNDLKFESLKEEFRGLSANNDLKFERFKGEIAEKLESLKAEFNKNFQSFRDQISKENGRKDNWIIGLIISVIALNVSFIVASLVK